MPVKHSGKTPQQILADVKKALQQLPTQVGNEAINFFKGNFKKEGFQDASLQPWKPRSPNAPRNKDRRLLVNTALLFKSFDKQISPSRVKVFISGAAARYAPLHNEGGAVTVPITKQMRKYFWAMFFKTGNELWKARAITKAKVMNIQVPQRKFIGNSPMLNKKIHELSIRKLKNAFE